LLSALESAPAAAQSLTPDLFNPSRGGFVSPERLPTRRTAGVLQAPSDAIPQPPDPNENPRKKSDAPATTRVGQVPT
jgi:hypothetical protein